VHPACANASLVSETLTLAWDTTVMLQT
jgi:hypothetical protein